MLILIGLALLLATLATGGAVLRARQPRTFPPVVELAHVTPAARINHKVASLTAKPTRPRPPARLQAAPVPFAQFAPSPSVPTPAPALTPAPVAAPAPPTPAPTPVPSPPRSVYETHKSPYAAPVVTGSLISLPDDGDGDLTIAFRSHHPSARPIVEAGDSAERVQIAAADGRIHVGHASARIPTG